MRQLKKQYLEENVTKHHPAFYKVNNCKDDSFCIPSIAFQSKHRFIHLEILSIIEGTLFISSWTIISKDIPLFRIHNKGGIWQFYQFNDHC